MKYVVGLLILFAAAGLSACDKAPVNIEKLSGSNSGNLNKTTPVITPLSMTGFKVSSGSSWTFSALATDADGDALTYTWTVNGASSSALLATGSSATLTTDDSMVGPLTVTLAVSDGIRSASYSWSGGVNYFNSTCNDIDNLSQTNKTCVYSGIQSIGDGAEPVTEATTFMIAPTDMVTTAAGDLFIADGGSAVVWFWNRGTVDKTILNVVVPAGKAKVVAGVGTTVNNPGSTNVATRYPLNSPEGLAYDETNLYISNLSSVIRVTPAGLVENVLTTGCTTARGLALYGNTLYVACYASHVVKSVDVTTLAATTVVGTGSPGNPSSMSESIPTGSDGVLNSPHGVAVDSSGNLYISELTPCRIRMLNNTAGTISLYGGGWTIGSGKLRIVLGTNAISCGGTAGEAVDLSGTTNASIYAPKHLSFDPNGNLLIAGSITGGSGIYALNFSSTSASILGVAVPSYQVARVAGTGSYGYTGEGLLATSTPLWSPSKMLLDPLTGDYFLADTNNRRLRKVSSSDFKISNIMGSGTYRSLGGTATSSAPVSQERYTAPHSIVYDSLNKITFIADYSASRIRMINQYGVASQAVGSGGVGSGNEENELPLNVTMQGPHGMAVIQSTASFGGNLVWTDISNHRVRIWNRSNSSATLFGVNIGAGRVATIGGDGTSGNLSSGSALASAFNLPSGLAYDPSSGKLYVADTNNHCIKAIDSSGTLSAVTGICGTPGNVNGAFGTARLSAPEGLAYYNDGANSGLFIADRNNSRIKFYRLSGTGSIAGIPVSLGYIATIAGGGTFHDENIMATSASLSLPYYLTTNSTDLCFNNFGYQNFRCINISTGLIRTVLGSPQGTGSTATWFSGTSISSTNQNGISAYADPAQGLTANPTGIAFTDSSTLLMTEAYSGVVRKVRP